MLQPSALVEVQIRCFHLNLSEDLPQTNIYITEFIDSTNYGSGGRATYMIRRYYRLRDIIKDPVSFSLFVQLPQIYFSVLVFVE